jgi:ribose transport system permease protein
MSQGSPGTRLDYVAAPPPKPLISRLLDAAGESGKKELAIGALLLVLCTIIAIINPRFLSVNNLQNQAAQIGYFGIYAIGLGIVIITGGIDLSVGSVFALQGVMLSTFVLDKHWHWAVAAVAAIGLTVVLGLIHAFFITGVRLQPFLVTLCGMMAYRSLARDYTHENTRGFSGDFGWLKTLAVGRVGPVPCPFICLIVVATIMWIVLHRSVYGRYLFAVGRNADAARYSGINTKVVIGGAYVLCMLLAGFSGIGFAFYTGSISPSTHGEGYELFGIAAAVLGGCSLRGGEGSILGIILGTILLQILRNMITLLQIDPALELLVTATVIMIGVTVDELLSRRRKARKGIQGLPAPSEASTKTPPVSKTGNAA